MKRRTTSRRRDAFAAALARVIEREQIAAVVPTHPVEVRAVAELRDAGGLGGAGTALPALEAARDNRSSVIFKTLREMLGFWWRHQLRGRR